MIEVWKTCSAHNSDYMISNYGNILSFKKDKINGKIMKNCKEKDYLVIRFYKDCKKKAYLIHRLVMHYFFGPCPEGMEVDHINRIRNDNRICNLRYVTHSENNLNKKNTRYDILETDPVLRRKIRMKGYNYIYSQKKENCNLCGKLMLKYNIKRHKKIKHLVLSNLMI